MSMTENLARSSKSEFVGWLLDEFLVTYDRMADQGYTSRFGDVTSRGVLAEILERGILMTGRDLRADIRERVT